MGGRGSPRARGRRLNTLKVCVFPDPPSRRERQRGTTRAPHGSPLKGSALAASLLVRGDGEALAPLAAAVRENLLPASRLHAGTKAVGADATEVVGLIGPFHGAILGRGAETTIPRRGCQVEVMAQVRHTRPRCFGSFLSRCTVPPIWHAGDPRPRSTRFARQEFCSRWRGPRGSGARARLGRRGPRSRSIGWWSQGDPTTGSPSTVPSRKTSRSSSLKWGSGTPRTPCTRSTSPRARPR